jgi:hypothetical protein
MKKIKSLYIAIIILCMFSIYYYNFLFILNSGMTSFSSSISAINLQQLSNFWEGRWFQTTIGWRTHNDPLNTSIYGYGHNFITHIMITHLLLALPCFDNFTIQCSYNLQIVFNTSLLVIFLILYIKASNIIDKINRIILVLFLIFSTGLFLRLIIINISPTNFILGLFLFMHYFYKKDYKILCIFSFILVCFLQEDLSLFASSYFIYQYLFSKNKYRYIEITLIILGISYFCITEFYLMPLGKYHLSSIQYSNDLMSRFDNNYIKLITPKNLYIVILYLIPSVIVLYVLNKYVKRFTTKDYLFLLIPPILYWWSAIVYSAYINHKYWPILAVIIVLICDKINEHKLNINTKYIYLSLLPIIFVANIAYIPGKSLLYSKITNSNSFKSRISRNMELIQYIRSIPKHNSLGVSSENNLLGFFSNRPHLWFKSSNDHTLPGTSNIKTDPFFYKSKYIVIQKFKYNLANKMFKLYWCDSAPFICHRIETANNYYPNEALFNYLSDKSNGYRLIVNNDFYSSHLRVSDTEIVDPKFTKQIFGFIPHTYFEH